MRITVFFMCLLFLLTGRTGHTYAAITHTHKAAIYNKHHRADNTRVVRIVSLSPDALIKDINLDKETGDLFNDVEDEDTDNIFVKKCKTVARSCNEYAFQYNQYSLISLDSIPKAAYYVCHIVSCKYILQRTLRI